MMSKVASFLRRGNPFSVDNTRYLKGFVSIYPAFAAVFLAAFKDRIFAGTGMWREYWQGHLIAQHPSIDWVVLLYWILLIIWVIGYFRFVTNESASNKRTTEGLRSAIFRSPNPKVFGEYELFYEQIMVQLNQIDRSNISEHEGNILKVLNIICLLTGSYMSDRNGNVIYGANIMLYLPYKYNKAILDKVNTMTDETWIHSRGSNIGDLFNGALFLPGTLIFKSSEKYEVGSNPKKQNQGIGPLTQTVICQLKLPVYKVKSEEDSAIKNIPGAPRAAMDKKFLFKNVRDNQAYEHLGATECKNAEQYWRDKQPKIKSILSFGIPHTWDTTEDVIDVIGVLNIDSTETDILGTDAEYHKTFSALIYPILYQLKPYLEDYYKFYISKL